MTKRQSHNAAILAALKKGARLTIKSARRLCGTERLAARIWDLRTAGYPIETIETPDEEYATYRLARKRKAA